MGKVRLREASQTGQNGATPAPGIALKPLKVSGIVIARADLIAALQIYANVRDIQTTEDGETFILILGEGAPGEDPSAR